MSAKKKIGIIGGMGPLATVELFRMLVEKTKSTTDAGHIRIFIDNNPQIPDRTRAIIQGEKSPVSAILTSARNLEKLGSDLILIPCNTSHYFFQELQSGIGIEIINMIDETAREILSRGFTTVGLLASNGTVQGRVYHDVLEPYGIKIITPTPKEQCAVMEFIYSGVKAGNVTFNADAFMQVVCRMFNEGAQTIILGCTEVPVGMKMYGLNFEHIDAMEILANAAILKAGYELVEQACPLL